METIATEIEKKQNLLLIIRSEAVHVPATEIEMRDAMRTCISVCNEINQCMWFLEKHVSKLNDTKNTYEIKKVGDFSIRIVNYKLRKIIGTISAKNN